MSDMKYTGDSKGIAPFWVGEARLVEGGGPCRVRLECGCRVEWAEPEQSWEATCMHRARIVLSMVAQGCLLTLAPSPYVVF